MNKEYDIVKKIRGDINKSQRKSSFSNLFSNICCAYDISTTPIDTVSKVNELKIKEDIKKAGEWGKFFSCS